MSEWQDISTAPKDGTSIIGAWYGKDEWLYGVFVWRESQRQPGLYGWWFVCTERFNKPTHWMPLPKPTERMKKLEGSETGAQKAPTRAEDAP